MKCVNLDDFKDRCPKVDCGDKCSDVPFRKVNIPASMGDDITGEYIPENGLYKNAFVEYEANGALYIYSSDGIFTKLGFNTQGGGEVSKQYVDIQDASTLQAAKDYADSQATAAGNAAQDYAYNISASNLQTAKDYADAQDALTLQAAKDYTDAHSGQGGVSQQYVDDHDAATLQDAKDYADGQISSAVGDLDQEVDDLRDSLAQVAFTGDYDDLIGAPDQVVITMTDTDPGEGVPLPANHFIAVYQGSN